MLKPIYRGGRIVGFRDRNGFPVPLKDGISGDLPIGEAPLVRQKAGQLIFSGGTPEAVDRLVQALEGEKKEIELGKEPKPWEKPGSTQAQEALAPRGKPRPLPSTREILK